MRNRTGRQGFTLVELVVVLFILSILAAFSLPRFMDTTDEAHDSVIKAVHGSFNTAAVSARAQWLTEGGTGNSVNFSGTSIPVSNLGWPRPVTGTMDCNGLWDALMQNPPPVTTLAFPLVSDDGFWSFTVSNAGLSMCYYFYRAPYPGRLMWIAYYGHHATNPSYNGRFITSGF